jgi:hypothetical protein
MEDDYYHIRKQPRPFWPYTLYYGRDFPWATVVGVYMSLKAAKRGMERDKKRRATPLPPTPPMVWRDDSGRYL